MSTRSHIPPFPVIIAGSMAATSITSSPTILQTLTKVSYEASWTGTTPIGILEVQVSNSYKLTPGSAVQAAGNWTVIPLQDNTGAVVLSLPVTGNIGTAFIDVTTAANAIRLVYTKTSGIGTMTAIVSGKVA